MDEMHIHFNADEVGGDPSRYRTATPEQQLLSEMACLSHQYRVILEDGLHAPLPHERAIQLLDTIDACVGGFDLLLKERDRLRLQVASLQRKIQMAAKEHGEEIRDMERDMRAEMREVAAEQRWQERLGDDYGSY